MRNNVSKALQQALHIEISFDKVLQGDFGFLLNTLTTAFSYVCRLSEIQKVLLEVKSPSYAFLTFHFYTPPIGEENGFGRIISVEVFKKLQKFSVSSVLKPIFWENSNSN